jgi:hypothetical protein
MPSDDEALKRSAEKMLAGARFGVASRDLLALLFPKMSDALEAVLPLAREERGEEQRSHRISHKDYALSYFGLTADPLAWGRKELENLFNRAPDDAAKVIEQRIKSSPNRDQSRLRRQFLEALDGAFDDHRPFTSEWLRVLANLSPLLLETPDYTRSFLSHIDNTQRLRTALFAALRPLDSRIRGDIFYNAAQSASDLSLLCSLFRTIVGDTATDGISRREPEFFAPRTEEIRILLLTRVKEMARTLRFWKQVAPGDLLWFWWGCDDGEVMRFTTLAMSQPDGLRALLTVPIQRVFSTEGDYNVVHLYWDKIVDLSALASFARVILNSPEINPDRQVAESFLKAWERGQQEPPL